MNIYMCTFIICSCTFYMFSIHVSNYLKIYVYGDTMVVVRPFLYFVTVVGLTEVHRGKVRYEGSFQMVITRHSGI